MQCVHADVLLRSLGRNFNSLVKQSAVSERKDMMEAPELRTHVFCRVTEDIGAVAVDDTGHAALPHHSDRQWLALERKV